MFKGGNKGFGVSAVLIVRETGANVSFNAFMEIFESTPLPSQLSILQPTSLGETVKTLTEGSASTSATTEASK